MGEQINRLELCWIDKNKEIKLEPRILIEDSEKNYGDKCTENILIHGDNLLALKALEEEYSGKVKCIYIDPPYNINIANPHYSDFIPHSEWLTLMKTRVEVLYKLLADDGFFCCHIDDEEGHYLKIVLDEVFGRNNYLTTLYVQVRYTNKTLAEDNDYQKVIEQCFVYSKNKNLAKPNKSKADYKIEKFEWEITELEEGENLELGGKSVKLFKPGKYKINKIEPSFTGLKETWATGSLTRQKGSSGEFFEKNLAPRKAIDGLGCLYKVDGIGEDGLGYRYFTGPKKATAKKGKFYSGIPLDRLELLKKGEGEKDLPIHNFHDLSGNFGNCRLEGGVAFGGGKKPEALIQLIIKHFSNEGDIVLDSFLGSGTTAAVAHKMNRKWIGIELGEHCYTHCIPRIKSVISGEDKTGISKELDWKGGGGFRFYELAPSLLKEDRFGTLVIDERYNQEMIAIAMCKQEGFKYNPDQEVFWKQGYSYEKDYIFITSNFITPEYLDSLYEDMKGEESLLICCKAYHPSCIDKYENINIKKIPQELFGKFEYGKDNYNLNIIESDDIEGFFEDVDSDEGVLAYE